MNSLLVLPPVVVAFFAAWFVSVRKGKLRLAKELAALRGAWAKPIERERDLEPCQSVLKARGLDEQLPREADAHYAGKGVKLGAADTPIFWYRPKGAKKYRIMCADLSMHEADTAPNLPNAQPVVKAFGPKE